MLYPFQKFLTDLNLFAADDRILLAVSGGVDSVVMCELFHRSGFHFGIIHCNFKLRGEESEEDENFVNALAKKHNVPFYCKSFNTSKLADKSGISIQMAARKLRYEWFEEIREKEQYKAVAVAQHKDDEIETLLINLVRGTGIAGLHGISSNQHHIIRPLLFSNRTQIEAFSIKHQLKFREDSSNLETKYIRNKIRHKIIPVLKEINPHLEETIAKDIERIRDAEQIFKTAIRERKKEILIFENNRILFPIDKLKQLNPIKTYLFEFLQEYHFNAVVINEIIEALDGISGKQFFSPTHRILKDREHLILTEIKETPDGIGYITEKQESLDFPIRLHFSKELVNPDFKIPASTETVFLDDALLSFPLMLRKWKEGDVFVPLGMKTKKKLSDFFIDNKLSIADKENTWVLVSDGNIIWVIGHRIDDRYKITERTKKVYIVTCRKEY